MTGKRTSENVILSLTDPASVSSLSSSPSSPPPDPSPSSLPLTVCSRAAWCHDHVWDSSQTAPGDKTNRGISAVLTKGPEGAEIKEKPWEARG